MRRKVPLALAVLLAACTVTTTGAPCASDANCPSDQKCGMDGICGSGASSCAPNPGPVFHVDPVVGSSSAAPPHATGVASPPACRFSTLTEALAAANARGPGSTVRVSGFTAAAAGPVVLEEPGALQVGPGVALATDDAPPVLGHYVVTTAATLTAPLVTVGPGGSIAGLELRNGTSSGDGIATSCPGAGDLAAVALSTLKVTAATAGPPVARLSVGIRVAGACPATMASITVEGAGTGVVVESASDAVESTGAGLTLTGSTTAGAVVAKGRLAFTGGTVSQNASGVLVGTGGTGAPTFSATGTTFAANTGDGIAVTRGTLLADGCPFTGNGSHVRAQPSGGAAVDVTVQNSSGAARMTGAANSAFRLLALGAGSRLVLVGNEIQANHATQDYTVASGQRRGGGIVFTAPFAGTVVFRGNTVSQNEWDQVLVAASIGALDLRGGSGCLSASPADRNTFKCYDAARQGVGLYSNGASVQVDWNHWTNQPAVDAVDFAGTGISGENTACSLDRACP